MSHLAGLLDSTIPGFLQAWVLLTVFFNTVIRMVCVPCDVFGHLCPCLMVPVRSSLVVLTVQSTEVVPEVTTVIVLFSNSYSRK